MSGKDRKREEGSRKKGGIGNFLSTLVIVIALGVFCYAGYQLVLIYLDYKVGTDEYSELEEFAKIIPASEQETEEEPGGDAKKSDSFDPERMVENETMAEDEWGMDAELHEKIGGKVFEEMENPVDFKSLLSINEDIIGWLRVDALDISYPVVQGEDNDYYLHRTFKRQDNFAGSIFLDCMNSPTLSNRNNIVYGHNMKNGSMFGTLRKLGEQETYDKSPYFWIYTPTRIYKYEIFNASVVGAYSDSYQIAFSDAADFQDFVNTAKQQSQVKNDVQVHSYDTVITLSTCTGDYSTRFIVQGKRVRTYAAIPKAGGYEAETEPAS